MKPFTIRKAAAPTRGQAAARDQTSNEAGKYSTAP